jgi:hypothetical protein
MGQKAAAKSRREKLRRQLHNMLATVASATTTDRRAVAADEYSIPGMIRALTTQTSLPRRRTSF